LRGFEALLKAKFSSLFASISSRFPKARQSGQTHSPAKSQLSSKLGE